MWNCCLVLNTRYFHIPVNMDKLQVGTDKNPYVSRTTLEKQQERHTDNRNIEGEQKKELPTCKYRHHYVKRYQDT